jgi:hypothetical protein
MEKPKTIEEVTAIPRNGMFVEFEISALGFVSDFKFRISYLDSQRPTG